MKAMLLYQTVAHYAQVIGLCYFVAMFVVAFFYALRPKNRGRFEKAALIPFEDDTP